MFHQTASVPQIKVLSQRDHHAHWIISSNKPVLQYSGLGYELDQSSFCWVRVTLRAWSWTIEVKTWIWTLLFLGLVLTRPIYRSTCLTFLGQSKGPFFTSLIWTWKTKPLSIYDWISATWFIPAVVIVLGPAISWNEAHVWNGLAHV